MNLRIVNVSTRIKCCSKNEDRHLTILARRKRWAAALYTYYFAYSNTPLRNTDYNNNYILARNRIMPHTRATVPRDFFPSIHFSQKELRTSHRAMAEFGSIQNPPQKQRDSVVGLCQGLSQGCWGRKRAIIGV